MRSAIISLLAGVVVVVACNDNDDDGSEGNAAGAAGGPGAGKSGAGGNVQAGHGGDVTNDGGLAGANGQGANGQGGKAGSGQGGLAGDQGTAGDSPAGNGGNSSEAGATARGGAGESGAASEGGAGGESGAVQGWPLVPASLPSECSPNCSDGTCHEECEAGSYPCDSGCCEAAVTFGEAPAGDNYVNATSLAVDTSDHAWLAYTATLPFLARSSDQTWSSESIGVRALPIAEDEETGPLFDRISRPYLALDGGGTAFVAYDMYDSFSDESLGFLTTVVASDPPIYDELPSAPRGLTVGRDGRAAVLLDHQILERSAPSTFETIAVPTTATLGAIAFANEHYFVAASTANEIEVWYRSSGGQWGSETIPVAGAGRLMLQVRQGVAYVGYMQGNSLSVARRTATDWEIWHVPAPNDVWQAAFDVDDCGSPHFLIWEEAANTIAGWDDRYLRWTAEGWRSFPYDAGCYFGDGPSVVLTSTHTVLASASCTATIVTVPRALVP